MMVDTLANRPHHSKPFVPPMRVRKGEGMSGGL